MIRPSVQEGGDKQSALFSRMLVVFCCMFFLNFYVSFFVVLFNFVRISQVILIDNAAIGEQIDRLLNLLNI